jgi:hypothetical protein
MSLCRLRWKAAASYVEIACAGLAEIAGEVIPAGSVARAVEPTCNPSKLVDQNRRGMAGNAPLRDLLPVVVRQDRKLPTVFVDE